MENLNPALMTFKQFIGLKKEWENFAFFLNW